MSKYNDSLLNKLSSEIENVSVNYSKKFGINRDSDWFILKLQEELGELIQAYLMLSGQARKKGKTEDELVSDFHKEVADVFSHVLLLARHHSIDLEKEVSKKWLSWNNKKSER